MLRRSRSPVKSRLRECATLPEPGPWTECAHALVTVAVDDRAGVRERLAEVGVPSVVYYALPLHRMPAFRGEGAPPSLPVCERLCERVLSLPMHAYLSDDQAHHVCDSFERAAR